MQLTQVNLHTFSGCCDVYTKRIAHIPHTDPASSIHPKNIPLEFRRGEPRQLWLYAFLDFRPEQHAIPIFECFMQRGVPLLR